MNRAIVKCDEALMRWRSEGFDGYMILTVHDELVFDFPADHPDNLTKIREIKQLMESCGDDLGIPTPVSAEKHVVDWSVGEVLKL
jgi:DNA polymerase I-like protein with 3'-5' exonuclease and polymerase domains